MTIEATERQLRHAFIKAVHNEQPGAVARGDITVIEAMGALERRGFRLNTATGVWEKVKQ
jgi:hypothetical protein